MQAQEVIEGWRGVMVTFGLGRPIQRAVTATVATGLAMYAAGKPASSFDREGRPHPNFLLIPLAVGTAAWLFT